MTDPGLLLPYIAACFFIIIVPGPTVTVIIANAMRHGTRAGLLNVVGTQIGLFMMMLVLALGLSAVVNVMGSLFEVLRILGAGYLIWLGIRMWRSDGALATQEGAARPGGSFVLQGIIVVWSNPKALLFFGAFIPQFIDPALGNPALQTVFLGLVFMAVATIGDGLYAVLAGGAGARLSRSRIRLTERISGTCLIGGGLWLALARR
ncbi:LysE family translocator [Nitratireductor pacificus]|uniref:Lysine exporter protein LysE/YggA n=1 Tax=Nitratireductor pacificus pht-3B TaxID=391937 RepID=K2M968_9HYPH|nr:LysE family translocator [Nitratireductor pacificus]EKF17575.1 lysine exporter protein LysE/YggA [Nitratireductor pacificus pht-3B]